MRIIKKPFFDDSNIKGSQECLLFRFSFFRIMNAVAFNKVSW